MQRLTYERLELLKTIQDICENNEFEVAPIKEVIEKLGKRRVAVAKMMYLCKLEGLVYSPLRGTYRLTERGKKLFEKE